MAHTNCVSLLGDTVLHGATEQPEPVTVAMKDSYIATSPQWLLEENTFIIIDSSVRSIYSWLHPILRTETDK